MIKKTYLTSLVTVIFYLISKVTVKAAQIEDHATAKDLNASIQTITEGVGNLIVALQFTAILVGVIFVIVAGISYATSAGNPDKAKSGKETLQWAIIAIIAAVAITFILDLILNILGLPNAIENRSVEINLPPLNFK